MTLPKQARTVRIQSLARASVILEAISRNGTASLAVICKATGFNKTTAFYLLESLVDLGFVERTERRVVIDSDCAIWNLARPCSGA